jgi:hypothetical protein
VLAVEQPAPDKRRGRNPRRAAHGHSVVLVVEATMKAIATARLRTRPTSAWTLRRLTLVELVTDEGSGVAVASPP